MNNKNSLRKLYKQEDKSIYSKALCDLLKTSEFYQKAQHIMIFYPMKNEVNLLGLLQDKSKTFYLPRIKDTELECCSYCLNDELCLSSFKTKEPLTKAENKDKVDLIIVPALCCDKNNYRLGYGGGFYDKFLQDFAGMTVACVPKHLIIDTIYPEKFDVPMNLVISC